METWAILTPVPGQSLGARGQQYLNRLRDVAHSTRCFFLRQQEGGAKPVVRVGELPLARHFGEQLLLLGIGCRVPEVLDDDGLFGLLTLFSRYPRALVETSTFSRA